MALPLTDFLAVAVADDARRAADDAHPTCSARNCAGEKFARNLCAKHYQRSRRGTRASQDAIAFGRELAKVTPCLAHGCERMAEVASKGTCNAHYHRLRVHGSYTIPLKPPAQKKRCGACGEVKLRDQFHRSGQSRYGLKGYCKSCANAYNVKNNVRHWTRKYGIEVSDYEALVAAQGGVCAICQRPGDENRKHKRLYVDHCHDSGKVRGLLCHGCNVALGFMVDDPERLEAAAVYLRERG